MKHSSYIALFFVLLGIAAPLFASEKNGSISLEPILKLSPGEVSKNDITKLFGIPTEIVDFSKLPNTKLAGLEWLYKQNGQSRVTFLFEEGVENLASWSWAVHDGEPEEALEAAKGRFPGSDWEAKTEKWINPHAFPSECFYKDEKKGVSITFNLVRRKVSSISHWNIQRKIATDKEEKPPMYCLGSACTPAIPASEFFKDTSVAQYCKEVH